MYIRSLTLKWSELLLKREFIFQALNLTVDGEKLGECLSEQCVCISDYGKEVVNSIEENSKVKKNLQ